MKNIQAFCFLLRAQTLHPYRRVSSFPKISRLLAPASWLLTPNSRLPTPERKTPPPPVRFYLPSGYTGAVTLGTWVSGMTTSLM